MKQSPEIEKLMRDIVAAIDRGDTASVERSLSHEPGVVMIGTSPDEYTRTQEAMHKLLEDSTPEGSTHIHVALDDVTGYEEGDVAWSDSTGTFKRDNDTVAVRFTSVFRREQGEWRCVQAHSSFGVPNELMFDATLRTDQAARA